MGCRRMIQKRELSEVICTQFAIIWGTESPGDIISCQALLNGLQEHVPLQTMYYYYIIFNLNALVYCSNFLKTGDGYVYAHCRMVPNGIYNPDTYEPIVGDIDMRQRVRNHAIFASSCLFGYALVLYIRIHNMSTTILPNGLLTNF